MIASPLRPAHVPTWSHQSLVMARTACEARRGLVFAEGEIPSERFLR